MNNPLDRTLTEADLHRIATTTRRAANRLDDDAARALRQTKDWRGHLRTTTGGTPTGDPSDPTSRNALTHHWTADAYDHLHRIATNVAYWSAALETHLTRITGHATDLPDLERTNTTAGECNACGTECTGRGDDRLRTPHRHCPACTAAWRRAKANNHKLDLTEWEKLRRRRTQRETQ